jgi:hypothetical protein
MKAGAATILAVLAAGSLGCGDEEPTELETREEIATTINEVREALGSGDGETVCGALTEPGRRIMIRIATREPRIEGDTCEQVVEAIAARFTDAELQRTVGKADYSAADVDIDPSDDEGFNGVTDVEPKGGPSSVEVPCKRGGGSYFVAREADEWRLMFPFCSGR